MGEQNAARFKSSNAIGSGVNSAKKDGRPAWAHLNTNYELGTDKMHKTTDYQSRFADSNGGSKRSQSLSNAIPNLESAKNKAKIQADSVVIAGNSYFDTSVSSRSQF